MNMREEFEAAYAAIPPITTTRDTAWICWQAASAGKAELLEALKALVCMLPSDHTERRAEERIPLSYCYVRWQDIRQARAAIAKHGGTR